MHATDAPSDCENCATPLRGRFCHACGQPVANPLRHTGHAIEEFFEAFWHLDGRVFRTLRELMRPGLVAVNYLAGRRARYIAPLRLFVVLTVLAFLVGRLTVDADRTPVQVQATGQDIAAAPTVAEAERRLARELAGLDEARARMTRVPGMARALDEAETDVRRAAATRIAQLRGQPAPAAAQVEAGTRRAAARRDTFGDGVGNTLGGWLRTPGRAWHEHDNPVAVPWLPAFADRALNHRLANVERNARQLQADDDADRKFVQAMLGAVPSALFLLVPVFALLLKLLYIGTGRGYLEHLVVALYSHAFLLVVLAGLFVTSALAAWLKAAGSAVVIVPDLLFAALWLWVPVYLLLMQKRVYAQGWAVTVVKYLVGGGAYLVLLLGVLLYAVFVPLSAG